MRKHLSGLRLVLVGGILATGLLSCKNSPPLSPEAPAGVSIGGPTIPYQFTATATDPEGDSITIRFSWGDGDTSAWSRFVSAGETVAMSHVWRDTGHYQVRAQAQDKGGGLSAWSRPCLLTIGEGILKWRYQTCDEIGFSSPAIGSDGTVYFGSDDGWLYALNPDGTLKWRYLIESELPSSPAIGSDGTVYIGANEHYILYALNPDGTLKWRYDVQEGTIYPSPAIASDGTVYVGSNDGSLYALNTDGTLKWRYQTKGPIVFSSPAIAPDGTVFIGAVDGALYAIQGSGTLADSPWPKFHHDLKNTGRVGGGR